MALTLPTVPSTVYAAGVSQVRSADLNDFEAFMAAVKAYLESGDLEGVHSFDSLVTAQAGVTLSGGDLAVSSGTVSASGDVTSSAGDLVGVNCSVSGQYKHSAPVRRKISPVGYGISHTAGNVAVGASGSITIPIMVHSGERITGLYAYFAADTTDASCVVEISLFRTSGYAGLDPAVTVASDNVTSVTFSLNTELSDTGLTEDVSASDTSYYATFSVSATYGGSVVYLRSVEIDVVVP